MNDADTEQELPLQALVDLWRQKVMAGTITDDELRHAVETIREGRIAAAALGAERRAKRGPPRSAEELLAGFMTDDGGEESEQQ